MSDSAKHGPDCSAPAYYIHEAPLRLWHGISAICIVVLSVTGYFIGRPLPGEAALLPLTDYIRLTHFTAAYVFSIGMLYGIYWRSAGNRYTREGLWAPFWRKSWRRHFLDEVRGCFIPQKQPLKYMGHNPIGQLAMVGYVWLAVFMVLTGFALYGEGEGKHSWVYALTGWITDLFGGDSLDVHYWHRLGMWGILLFVMAHIGTAVREDIMTRQSMIASMVNGWRMYKE